MIIEFIEFIFTILIYYIIFSIISSFLVVILKKNLKSKKQYVVLNATLKDVQIEVINDILYAYEKGTNNFLCQGSSLEEIAEKFNSYHKIDMVMVYYNNERFVLNNGKIYT